MTIAVGGISTQVAQLRLASDLYYFATSTFSTLDHPLEQQQFLRAYFPSIRPILPLEKPTNSAAEPTNSAKNSENSESFECQQKQRDVLYDILDTTKHFYF